MKKWLLVAFPSAGPLKRKVRHLVFLTGAALLLLPVPAFAQADFDVDPFHFGLGALATWARHAGEPDQQGDPHQYGLYLQKHTKTGNFVASGVRNMLKKPIPATSLESLQFDISGHSSEGGLFVPEDPRHGYCGAGAPRFNVVSTAGTCFLGCAHGNPKTQDPATSWWEIKFVAPFSAYPGCTAVSGTVTSITIVFDEGDDVPMGPPATLGTTSPGNVTLDNIGLNDKVVGKPQGAN